MHLPVLLQLRDWLPGFALAAACTWAPALLLRNLTPLPQLGAGLSVSLALYLGILRLAAPAVLRDEWNLLRSIRSRSGSESAPSAQP